MKIRCKTIFDITSTGVTGHYKPSRVPFVDRAGNNITDQRTWDRARNQQRNWETLTQLISLRTQVEYTSMPACVDNCWQFEFSVEIDHLFETDNDPLGILKKDCDGVPMLAEQADVTPLIAVDNNIWFEIFE